MAIRQANLGPLKAGITRLRDKGGASPESLFDLLNGYVDASGAPTSRAGTRLDHTLPAGTKGLCAFEGKLHVFALSATDPGNSDYVVDVLAHPDADFAGTLKAIHFAKPFLGFLYVVAEFSDGGVYHYWLQSSGTWSADHVYMEGDIVVPSAPNGLAYRATGDDHPPAWQANQQYAVGDEVQPTVYNGYKYRLVEASGDNPASGTTEPVWPTTEGAQVSEDIDNTPQSSTAAPSAGTGTGTGDRYSNLPGYKQQQLQQDLS